MKFFCGVIVAVALAWFLAGVSREPASPNLEAEQARSPDREATVTSFSIGKIELLHPAAIDESNSDPRFTRFTDGVSYWHPSVKLGRELHRESQTAFQDLEMINEILGNYRMIFKENPVGTDNEEFASALAGENAKKIVFIEPGLLSDGELLDRYGFPYMFHPQSADAMDLRSRGPDGQLWTEDDVSFDPRKGQRELSLVREE